jgi:hypothetical protein
MPDSGSDLKRASIDGARFGLHQRSSGCSSIFRK